MSAERSLHADDEVRPSLSLDELEEQQGLAGKPVPDYIAILKRMWPSEADGERTLETLRTMDELPRARRDAVLDI